MPPNPSVSTALIPYRQPFANPARNSAEAVGVSLQNAPQWKEIFTAHFDYGQTALDWVLGGGPRSDVVVFEQNMGHGWWLDLDGRREPLLTGATAGSFPAYQEDGDQLIVPRGSMLMLPDMAHPEDSDRARDVGAGGLSMPVHALIGRSDHFTVMSLRRPSRFDPRPAIAITRKPYTEGSLDGVSWQHGFVGELSAPSPALSDDTLIVCREGGLTFMAPGGAGFVDPAIGVMQGKVVAELDVKLRPGFVSADALDRVWGFRIEDGALVGWDAQGRSLGAPLPLDVSASQPPVALPGGALAIVAPGAVLKIDNGTLSWRAALPPDARPLATADRDGRLLVRAGRQLVLIDAAGKQLWNSELPAAITSNPLITHDGRLCVAAGLTLYCSR